MNVNKYIEANWRGIFATCDQGRESRCVAELYRLFEEVSYHPPRFPPDAIELVSPPAYSVPSLFATSLLPSPTWNGD